MKKQRSKYKIQTKGKSYLITDSPFYKLKTKKKLAALLGSSLPELNRKRVDLSNYNVFNQTNDAGKNRVIEHPVESLDKIHSRIASLLCRINTPNYVHSGVKGKSHVTNAKIHKGNKRVLTTDIKSFYPSTTREIVFRFFLHKMKCSPDVAAILSDVCTFDGHIPTGSRISMPLALWANIDMFRELNALSLKHEVEMTVYVDDITFSGNSLNQLFITTAKKVITRNGHKMHPKKTKFYNKDDVKVITGVVLRDSDIMIKNEQHKRISTDMVKWMATRDLPFNVFPIKGRLLGRLNSLAIIEPKLKEKARSISNYKPT